MIAEDSFKNVFADIFADLYPGLVRTMRDQTVEGNVTVLDLSVQIFTVPVCMSHKLVCIY
jgi:hypothetical protein